MKICIHSLRPALGWIGIAAIYVLPLLTLQGAVDMFLKFTPAIPGESTDSKHTGEIEVLAWSWGASNPGTFAAPGKSIVQDLSITKYVDKASPPLLLRTLNGQIIDSAVLTVRKQGVNPIEFLFITLTDVLVSSISTGGSSGEDRLTENVTFNFGKVEFKYIPVDGSGKAGTPITASWDVAAQK